MRARVLYILFVSVALLVVSSKQTSDKQLCSEIPSCQSNAVNKDIACIVPALNFLLKNVITGSNFLKLIYKPLFEDTNRSRTDLSANDLRLYRTKTIAFKPLKQKPFLILLHYSSEKEDDHHLLG